MYIVEIRLYIIELFKILIFFAYLLIYYEIVIKNKFIKILQFSDFFLVLMFVG